MYTKAQLKCPECDVVCTRADNLKRHMDYHCNIPSISDTTTGSGWNIRQGSTVNRAAVYNGSVDCSGNLKCHIPTFDGREFCNDKSLTRETLYKMMNHLGIPEKRWSKLATAELKYRNAFSE